MRHRRTRAPPVPQASRSQAGARRLDPVLGVDLPSAFFTCRATAQAMLASGHGRKGACTAARRDTSLLGWRERVDYEATTCRLAEVRPV